ARSVRGGGADGRPSRARRVARRGWRETGGGRRVAGGVTRRSPTRRTDAGPCMSPGRGEPQGGEGPGSAGARRCEGAQSAGRGGEGGIGGWGACRAGPPGAGPMPPRVWDRAGGNSGGARGAGRRGRGGARGSGGRGGGGVAAGRRRGRAPAAP